MIQTPVILMGCRGFAYPTLGWASQWKSWAGQYMGRTF